MRPDPTLTASLMLKLRHRDEVSEEEASVIAGLVADVQVVGAHQDIIKEGERPTYSTLLIEGFAARYKLMENGGRQITAVHTAGDFVDLHSFLLHHMDHGVSALTTCRVGKVPHESLRAVGESHPHLGRLLWLMTLIDGAIHREWLVAMGRLPAMGHVAHLICEIYEQLRVVGLAAEDGFNLPISQSDLADMCGLSAVHVNRVLQDLRARELISWRGAEVKILDHASLRRAGQFEDKYLHLHREPR